MSKTPLFAPLTVRSICRECGALCMPEAWRDRGGLCPRCAHGTRVRIASNTDKSRRLYLNGEEIVGDLAIDRTLRAFERDPIQDAIDRAAQGLLMDPDEFLGLLARRVAQDLANRVGGQLMQEIADKFDTDKSPSDGQL